MKLPHLILLPWAIYVCGSATFIIQHGPSRYVFLFGFIGLIGLASGIGAFKNNRHWHLWAAIASSAFLVLILWRHIAYIVILLRTHLSFLAAINQYLWENITELERQIGQQAFFSVFMYSFHEWGMPLLQFVILLLVIHERSNPSFKRDAALKRTAP